MRTSKSKSEAERFAEARLFEKESATPKAVEAYYAILKKNPLHVDATKRLLILLRKAKSIEDEVKLLTNSIVKNEGYIEIQQKKYIKNLKKIAEDSKPLAQMLGLLNAKELPYYEHRLLSSWKTRLGNLRKKLKANQKKISIKKATGNKT